MDQPLPSNLPAQAPAQSPVPDQPPHTEGWRFYLRRPPFSKRFVDHELIWSIVLPLSAALGLAYWKMGFPLPTCNLKTWTGVPCLSCGATRAMMLLVNERDILGAFLMNPLMTLAYFLCGLFVLYAVVVQVFRLPRPRVQVRGRAAWHVRYTIFLLLVLNWGYVIVAGR